MANTLKSPTTLAGVFVAVSILIGALLWLVPVPATWTGGAFDFHRALSVSALFTFLHIGASILFLMGAGAYKAKLRRAYLIVTISLVMIALGLVQVTIINAFDLMGSPWVQQGGIMVPFLLSGALVYIGVRSMARQIGVRSALSRFTVVLPIILASIIFAVVLPHADQALSEQYLDLTRAIQVWDISIYAICVVLAVRLRDQMGAHYTRSMAWLSLGLMGSVVISLTELAMAFAGLPQSHPILDILTIAGGLAYLKAGLEFARTKEL